MNTNDFTVVNISHTKTPISFKKKSPIKTQQHVKCTAIVMNYLLLNVKHKEKQVLPL